ncbi:hypothetical protein LF1_39080 [Rubripirellula obstinata]|uniref:DUF4397 domain-containing protein n=1 Tax=Rubripirellula obstinata TaxID=406547 RepID=A0A5B1CM52_9BACT|nr:hypothetical protein [Rubripirellula obstinata]KAA1261361.1 hypothetical protein LF1_39080 [Rubripirellula obstinata]
MYKLCLAALVAFAFPSMAMAGGGSSKTKGSIEVFNDSDSTVLVAVDPSDVLISSTTLEEFMERGGRVLDGGERTEFKNLNAGNHDVVAAFASSSVTASSFESATLRVSNGQKQVIRTSAILRPSVSLE